MTPRSLAKENLRARVLITATYRSDCRKLDHFARLCLCIEESDPKRGKSLLQLLGPCPGPFSGFKLRLQETINFKGVA